MLHQIGAGVLGPVFRTHESGGERLVAVKVFRLDITPEQARALAHELGALSRADLGGASIAAPIAAGVEGTVAYLAEEYVAGQSLDVTLQQPGSTPLGDVLRLVDLLADGLDAAASTGTNHGALHPRDVIVSAGMPHITGFGVARALERVGARPPIRRPYSAPERVLGTDWGLPADVFALAAIAHELIFGRRVASNPDQIPESLSAIDGAERQPLRDVFSRALATDPHDRYASARAFAGALRVAAEPATASVLPPSVEERPKQAEARPQASEWRPSLPLDLEPVPGPSPAAPLEVDHAEAGAFDTPGVESAHDGFFHGEPPSHEPPPTFEIQRRPGVIDDRSKLTASAATIGTGWPAEAPALNEQKDEDLLLDTPLTETDPVHEAVDIVSPARRSALLSPPSAQPTQSRSLASLVTMLLIGILVGGIGGYELAFRTAGSRNESAAAAVDTPKPSGTSGGREWTERSLQDSPGTATPPVPAETAGGTAPARETSIAPTDRGRLLVRSSPGGAQVLVNGDVRGVTPLTLNDVPYGTKTVRVIRSGYQPQRRRVSISAGRPSASVEVTLKPIAVVRASPATTIGDLSVLSRPAGAIVFLDGRRVGTTPLDLSKLSAGTHALRIEHAGYKRWSSSVRIAGGGRARVTASLERGSNR